MDDDVRLADLAGSTRRRYDIGRFLWGIPGTLLVLSVIGTPLGVPMLLRARRYQNRLAGEVPNPAIAVSTDGFGGVFDVVLGRRPMVRGSSDWRDLEFDDSEGDRPR